MEDIDGDEDDSTGANYCAHYFPTSSPAKRVVIQHRATDDIQSQHPSINSLEQRQSEMLSEDATSFQGASCLAQKSLLASNHDSSINDHLQTTSKLPNDKYGYDQDEIEAFLDNSSSSFAAEFDEIYDDFEASITRDAAGTAHSMQAKEPEMCSRLTDVASWSTFFANGEPDSPGWPSSLSDRDLGEETASVVMLDPEQIADDGKIVILSEDDDQSISHLRLLFEQPEIKHDTLLHHTISTKGFPGRFSMFQPEQLSWLGNEATTYTFGLTCHPNGRITNRAFVRDPLHQVTSLDEADIMHDTILSAAIRHAELTAAKLEPLKQMRTMEERVLRREIHRECALARLEGVSVGYFRYFAGHMTVEEYLAARICVCWSDCFCNKLCTRFGDMLCPCSGSLELCD